MVKFYLVFSILLAWSALAGNNIQIQNLQVAYEQDRPDFAVLTFDLSWENAWRTTLAPGNWDAAWVFVKYREGRNGEWQHLTLSRPTTYPTGAVVEVMDETGAMIYAATAKTGHANYLSTQLRFNLINNGISHLDILDFRIFGIEMVYIPQGAYSLGSDFKGKEIDKFYEDRHPNKTPAFSVAAAGEILLGQRDGKLNFGGLHLTEASQSIPAAFPEGYRAFYAMKYELSQQQYVDFFNTLTPTQKANHDITDLSGKGTDEELNRNSISYDHLAGGDATTSAPHVPVGYVSISDMLAYLDWSGLRPMTELEFEKACRGPVQPLIQEFAWGTDKIASWKFEPLSLNGFDESLLNLTDLDPDKGYAAYEKTTKPDKSGYGPMRSGIFSASVTLGVSRAWSGAGYYGNMELSGNQAEGVISVSYPEGRIFTNTHGNGFLPEDGYSDVPTWPQSALGIGIRGGYNSSLENELQVADRSSATGVIESLHARPFWLQFRGVRGL